MIEARGLVKRYGSTMAVSAEGGKLAAAHGIVLFELIPVRASLEEAFMELTRDSVEYQAAGATR
jgi:ABC-2 type transport system ATP-binding protein